MKSAAKPSFDECGFRPADAPCECGFEESVASVQHQGDVESLRNGPIYKESAATQEWADGMGIGADDRPPFLMTKAGAFTAEAVERLVAECERLTPSVAMRALITLEDRAQRYETTLMQILDAVDLADAKNYARRAISEAHFGPVDERGGSA